MAVLDKLIPDKENPKKTPQTILLGTWIAELKLAHINIVQMKMTNDVAQFIA